MELETLRKDMVAAMKAKDKTTKEAVSSLIAAAKKVAIDEGCRDDIPEALVDRVILKELKTVKEQLDTCPENREDLRAEYQARYDVIAKYAPQQMSEEEILSLIHIYQRISNIQIDTEEEITEEQNQQINSLMAEEYNTQLQLDSRYYTRSEMGGQKQTFQLIGFLLAGLLGIIGISNLVNTITSDVFSRKKMCIRDRLQKKEK